MATTTTTLTHYMSDLSENEAGHTVRFAIGDADSIVTYEIDLTDDEADDLFGALHPYIENGRRIIDLDSPRRARRSVNGRSHSDAKQVRAWAADNGVPVPAKGRIPQSVREQYVAAVG